MTPDLADALAQSALLAATCFLASVDEALTTMSERQRAAVLAQFTREELAAQLAQQAFRSMVYGAAAAQGEA